MKREELINKLEFSSSNNILFNQLNITNAESRTKSKIFLMEYKIKIDISVNNADYKMILSLKPLQVIKLLLKQ